MATSMLATPPNSNTRHPHGGALPDLSRPIPFAGLDNLKQDQSQDTQDRRADFESREEMLRRGEERLEEGFTKLARKERAFAQHRIERKKAYRKLKKERKVFEDEKREEARKWNKKKEMAASKQSGEKEGKKAEKMAGREKASKKSRQKIKSSAQHNADHGLHPNSDCKTELEKQRVAYEKDLLVVREQARGNTHDRTKKRLKRDLEMDRAKMEQEFTMRRLNLAASDPLPSLLPFELEEKWEHIKSPQATQQERDAFGTACRNAAQHHFGATAQETLAQSWLAIQKKILKLDVLAALQSPELVIEDLRDALPVGY